MRLNFLFTMTQLAAVLFSAFDAHDGSANWAGLGCNGFTASANTHYHSITVTVIQITCLYNYQHF